MTRDDIALQIFCAVLQTGGKIDLYERLGEKQIKVAFALADTFLAVSHETKPPASIERTVLRGGDDAVQ